MAPTNPRPIIPTDYDLSDKNQGRAKEVFAIMCALGLPAADAYRLAGWGPADRSSMRTSACRIRAIPEVAKRIAIYEAALSQARVINETTQPRRDDKIDASEALVIATELARDRVLKPSERLAALKVCIEVGDLKGKAQAQATDSASPTSANPGDPNWSRTANAAVQMLLQRMGGQPDQSPQIGAADIQSVDFEAGNDDPGLIPD